MEAVKKDRGRKVGSLEELQRERRREVLPAEGPPRRRSLVWERRMREP